jgi:hypothetical protein
VIRLAAALAIAVALTGCGPSVDSFRVHRFSATTQSEFPPLDRTVTDVAVASRLDEDVRAFDDHFEADLLGALGLYTRGNDLWPTPIPRP